MSSDVEPEAKRAKLGERKVVSVKMAAFEGNIEASILPNHPKNRYGEMPDGFSCLTMSPSKRYGADIQVFGEGHRSIKAIEFEKSGMIRVVDFAKLQYFYYWIDELNYGMYNENQNRFNISLKWLDDQSFLLIFAAPADLSPPEITIRKYKIDHKLMKIEEMWSWSEEFLPGDHTDNLFSITGLWPSAKGIYFFKGHCLNFVSLSALEKDDHKAYEEYIDVDIDFGTIDGVNREDQWFTGDKFVYFISENSPYDYLVRLSTVNLEFNNEGSWFSLDQYEKLELPASKLFFSAYNENYMLLHSKVEESGFFYYLVDVNDFTCKKLDFVGKPGDFAVFYNEYVVLFNHFEDRDYPLKDTPLKYRAFQITGSSVPSLQSLAGAVTVLSGSKLSTEHLRVLFGFDADECSVEDTKCIRMRAKQANVTWLLNRNYTSYLNSASRGMKFSELIYFDNKLLTIDDKTGIVYWLTNSEVIPLHIIAGGVGQNSKRKHATIKGEWMTQKDNHLYIGSTGNGERSSDGQITDYDNIWVKRISTLGVMELLNWYEEYSVLRDTVKIPGLFIA